VAETLRLQLGTGTVKERRVPVAGRSHPSSSGRGMGTPVAGKGGSRGTTLAVVVLLL
jgi:hypothetical protein